MQVLQGTSPHIKNETELEQLVEKLNAHADKEECLMMWTPYTDREEIWSSIWRISPDQLTSFLNIEQGEQWKVYQPWGQFRCRVPSMAGNFFLRKSISVVFPAIFLIYWVDQVFTFLKRNSAFNNFHNEYLSIKSYSYITCDKWPNQDGQPNGEELESGVAIHTLRMPNAYRCLFYPVRLYPEAKFFFVQGCGRGWKTVRCL